MPAELPVPNVVKVVISGVVGSVPWDHMLHFQYSGGVPTGAVLQTAAGAIFTQFGTHVITALSHTSVVMNQVEVTDLSSNLGAVGTHTGTTAGGSAGTANPVNVAFLINKAINRRYRGGHPRCYLLIGQSSSLASSNSWTGTFQSAAVNGYAAFITAVANGGAWPGIGAEVCVHRHSNHLLLNPPTVDIVQAYTSSPLIASQRRRIGR